MLSTAYTAVPFVAVLAPNQPQDGTLWRGRRLYPAEPAPPPPTNAVTFTHTETRRLGSPYNEEGGGLEKSVNTIPCLPACLTASGAFSAKPNGFFFSLDSGSAALIVCQRHWHMHPSCSPTTRKLHDDTIARKGRADEIRSTASFPHPFGGDAAAAALPRCEARIVHFSITRGARRPEVRRGHRNLAKYRIHTAEWRMAWSRRCLSLR